MGLIEVAQLNLAQGRAQYSQEKLADDVVAVIRHLGYEKCVLVGHGAPRLEVQKPQSLELCRSGKTLCEPLSNRCVPSLAHLSGIPENL